MSDSKSGSKTDLNESHQPLLEGEEKVAEEKADIPEKTMEVSKQAKLVSIWNLIEPMSKTID